MGTYAEGPLAVQEELEAPPPAAVVNLSGV